MNFESDSVKLINAVNGEDEKDRSSFGKVVLGILSLRRCFDSVSFKHVNRKANGAAHELPIMLMLSPTVLGWKMPLPTLCIFLFEGLLIVCFLDHPFPVGVE